MRTKPSRKQRLVDLITEKGILTETEAYEMAIRRSDGAKRVFT